MSDNNSFFSFYELVCVIACIYWITQHCRSRNNQNGTASQSPNQTANGGADGTATGSGNGSEEDARRRRELVRERLEFRTITATPPPSQQATMELEGGTDDKKDKTTQETTESGERDLEKGEESPTPPPSGDSSDNSNNNKNSSSARSLISNIFQRQSTRTDLNVTTETSPRGSDNNNTNNNNDDDDEDPPISSNENHFTISFLFQSMGLTTSGPETRQQECCSICLEPYKVGDRVARLKPENHTSGPVCNHWFHEDCILEWLQNHNECPLCRVNMVQS